MLSSQSSKIYTVTRLNQMVHFLLEQKMGQVWISGEISNFSKSTSGHWYFTLKDKTAQVRSAIFRSSNRRMSFCPYHGQQVLVRAKITLYESRGDFQIIVERMQPVGKGALQQKYEQLKDQLFKERLFDQKHKKPIPSPAHCVGIITSKIGDALYDILHVLKRRNPSLPIIIYPTSVQGDDAPRKIVQAIELANLRQECDVLIVGRGGGTLEDLWSFNDERVARAIFSSDIPIVSAVGHETNVTITDFVADLRAPTPSAAAEMISRNQTELLYQMQNEYQRLEIAIDCLLKKQNQSFTQIYHCLQQQHPLLVIVRNQAILEHLCQQIKVALDNQFKRTISFYHRLIHRLSQHHPKDEIYRAQVNMQKIEDHLSKCIQKRFSSIREHFSNVVTHLEAVSPLSTLARGYSVTKKINGKILKQTKQVKIGDFLITYISDGWIKSEVKLIK